MLIKLIKHEFRATARVMIPLYLVTILLAVMTRVSDLWTKMVTFEGLTGQSFLALISGIISVGFALALIATFVVAVVLTIQRFRSNLMADEGYVMFTLPVSTHSLVWSKLIVSTVWFLGAVVIDVVAMMTLVADLAMFQEIGRVFEEIARNLTAYNVVVCLVACLDFYAPLAIGHSFGQHKMLLSVAFFFAIQVAVQIVSGTLLMAGVPYLNSLSLWFSTQAQPMTVVHGMMWGSIVVSAIYGAILYCLTIRMLHRRLNLE